MISIRAAFMVLFGAALLGCGDTSDTSAVDDTVRVEPPRSAEGTSAVRNVILLIGDGMGFAQVRAFRGYQDDPLTEAVESTIFDRMLVGAVVTGGAGPAATVIDSAAAATAYATGQDTLNGMIGLGPDGNPLTTVVERARQRGKSTGIVTTSELTHATPASFATHVESRWSTHPIADQLLDNRIDGLPALNVLLGGGAEDLLRADRDLVSEFADLGYVVVRDRDSLFAVDEPARLLGVFAEGGLPRAWDRGGDVPSLAEMTSAAIDALSTNRDGFFLLVEGAQIDWAGHDNSIAGVLSEMEDFAAAVVEAVSFAESDPGTLVLVTGDHETGGLGIGDDDEYRWDPRPLRGVTATPVRMVADYGTRGGALASIVSDAVAFELTEDERAMLDAVTGPEEAFAAVCRMFDERSGTGWTTTKHTGVDVPLYAHGAGSERFRGVMANEEIGRILLELVAGDAP